MAAAEQGGGRAPDLYQLLGVSREASGGDITRAWRRSAAAEHPDRWPRDAAAPARFRALTAAYQVLGDPARRAVYDQSLGDQPGPGAAASEGPAAGATGNRPHGSGVPATVRRAGRVPESPLRAGPVWVEVPGTVPVTGPRAAENDVVRLVTLTEVTVRYLASAWDAPW